MKNFDLKSYLAPEIEVVVMYAESGYASSVYELNYSDDAGGSGSINEVIDGGAF